MRFLEPVQHHIVVLYPGNYLFLGQMLIPFQQWGFWGSFTFQNTKQFSLWQSSPVPLGHLIMGEGSQIMKWEHHAPGTITSENQYTVVGKCNLISNWLRNFPWNINSIFCSPLNVSLFFSFSLGSLSKGVANLYFQSVDCFSLPPFAVALRRVHLKTEAYCAKLYQRWCLAPGTAI